MQISLKVSKVVATDTEVVVKLQPSLIDPRTGDAISGELFLTTSAENAVLGLGDEIIIDFPPEEPTEPTA